MQRQFRGLALCGALAMAAMTGCSSSSTPSGTTLASTIVATWTRTQQSTDAGVTYVPQTDNYQLRFTSDGHWADNQGRAGTYVLNGNQCTLYILTVVNERMTIAAYSNNQALKFVFYSDSSFATATGYVQLYSRN